MKNANASSHCNFGIASFSRPKSLIIRISPLSGGFLAYFDPPYMVGMTYGSGCAKESNRSYPSSIVFKAIA